MTYTYAVLGVSPSCYREIRARLDAAGYGHAFHREDDGEVIDLHGIALQAEARPGVQDGETRIEVASILSRSTKVGRVELTVNEINVQMDLDKAREVVGMLHGAIEAATSDQILYEFLTKKIGLEDSAASAALLDFRELRQGSRGTVYPN